MTWSPEQDIRVQAVVTLYGATDEDIDSCYRILWAHAATRHVHVDVRETSREKVRADAR